MNRNALIIILMKADTSFSTHAAKEVNSEDAIAIGDVQNMESRSSMENPDRISVCDDVAAQDK